jgi:hypothetical protein
VTLADRFRRAVGGAGHAPGSQPPDADLARAGPDDPGLPPLVVRRPDQGLALPAPLPLPALPAPPDPVCPRCRERHAPRPLPGRDRSAGQGWAAVYSQRLYDPDDPPRPRPVGRGHGVDDRSLRRDGFRPWTGP